jgi:hypothetical protein
MRFLPYFENTIVYEIYCNRNWRRGVSAMAAHKADERRAIMQAAIARNSDLAGN